MPLLRIDATDDGPVIHKSPRSAGARLRQVARGAGPVVIMVHGFKFSPGDPVHCPHIHILSTRENPCRKAVSWPRGLGFDTGNAGEGLAIAFGWQARGTVWQAWERAALAGRQLADIILEISRIAPLRPIHCIAHSMGARVVLAAMERVPSGALNRVVLLAGAEFSGTALRAMHSPGGRGAEVINITSRENDLFDFALERLIAPVGEASIGQVFPNLPNSLTVQLDDASTLAALRRMGFPIAAPTRRICHWSAYLRPGVFSFYQGLMRQEPALPLTMLKAHLPLQAQPRWSRLFARPQISLPLPIMPKASS